jgi:hypothetical protein
MLSTFAPLRVNSAKHLKAHPERPFAAAQGDKKGAVRVHAAMRLWRETFARNVMIIKMQAEGLIIFSCRLIQDRTERFPR